VILRVVNARTLIDKLVEAQDVSFEHELEFEVNSQPLKAVINVTCDFENEGIGGFEMWGHQMHDQGSLNLTSMSFQVLAVTDLAGNDIEMTPELSRALEHEFESAHDTLSDRAYNHLGQ